MSTSIYIVDDDEAVRDSLQILLEAHGYRVRGYASGQDFLDGFEDGSQACVILDINMPVMSGIEVLQAARRRWPDLPVIMITGRAENVAKADVTQLGAQALLEKPFRDVTLVQTIEDTLAQSARG